MADPFLGESQVPMSMLCLPGTIGGGGMPGPFFFNVDELELARICGFAGCDAIDAHVIFFGTELGSFAVDVCAFVVLCVSR